MLDLAGGIGCEAIWAAKNGLFVQCNEIDPLLREEAVKRAQRANVSVRWSSFLWEDMTKHVEVDSFDLVILTGNSLSLCEGFEEARKVVKDAHSLVSPGGALIIDTRNFDRLLASPSKYIGAPLPTSHEVMYCGTQYQVRVLEVSSAKVTFSYERVDAYMEIERIDLLPVSLKNMTDWLQPDDAIVFSDFQPYVSGTAEFFTVVVPKSSNQ